MPYLISETLSDTLITYVVLKRLTKPWTDWDAYKLGLIDENGKKIKQAVTFEERSAWTILDRFMHNLKRLMEKFVGKSRLAAMLTAVYMLRDSIDPYFTTHLKMGTAEFEELSEMTYTIQGVLHTVLKECKEMPKLIIENADEFDPVFFWAVYDKYVKSLDEKIAKLENIHLLERDLL